MLKELKKELTDIFDERVAFHQLERILYSSDIGNLPGLLKGQITATPDAVVQPINVDELVALVNIAIKHSIPLVPRGSGTAGYGGAVPTMGGIAVDFYRLKKVIAISKEDKKVTVQPGAVWKDLDTELSSHGLALRLYPGSAISSTVGGWLANGGGVGIGSFEYGYFRDSVSEVEMITPKGIKRLTGDEVDLVYGMAGTTGLISEVTLIVRDGEDDLPILGAFDSLDGLLGALEEVKHKKLALWEVSYRNPLHIQLSRQAVEKQAKRAPVPGTAYESQLPDNRFIATFSYPKSRDRTVKDSLLNIIDVHGGGVLEDAIAGFLWGERFYPMRLGGMGPSLLLSEAIIPTEKLFMLEEITGKLEGVAFRGTMINRGEETLVQIYVLDDERRQGFPLTYSNIYMPIEAAKKFGGRPYTIGMYFIADAELLLGKDKLFKIYEFKKEVDREHMMNPGKVFPASLEKDLPLRKLNQTIKSMQAREELEGDQLSDREHRGEVIGQKTVLGKLPFGKEVEWDAFACTRCGFCRSVCPQFEAIGWESASPRGKFNFIKEYLKGNTKFDERMAEMFFVCTTCRQCSDICQVKAPIDEDWTLTIKPAILKEGFHPPLIFQRQAYNILFHHNPGGFPQDKRKGWMTPDLKYREEGEVAYFVGCAATFTYTLRNLAINAIRILNRAGIEPVYLGSDEWCCGGPMFSIGCIEEVQETVTHNINEMNKRGIKKLITSCSGGWQYLNHFYRLLAQRLGLEYSISVKHITEVISDLIGEGRIECQRPVRLKVTFHDPCHIGRGGGIFDPPRKILKSIPDLELVEMPRNREHSACCGKNIMRYPRLGGAINMSRVMEAIQTGASALVSCCPTCENNLRLGVADSGAKLEVIDISDLVAETMGLPRLAVSKLARLLHKQEKGH